MRADILAHEEICGCYPPSVRIADFVQGLSFPAARDWLCGVLYYRFPLSLRMIEEMLAALGIELTDKTTRC